MNQCILWIKFSHIRCFFFNAALRHTLWGYCLKYCVFEFDMGLFSSKSWNIIDMDGRMSPALPSTSSSCGSMASMASMVAEGGRRGGGYSWWSHADVQCSRREKIAHVLARWALHVHCQTQWGTMHWYRKNYCQFISKKKTQKKRPLENREQQSCEDKKKNCWDEWQSLRKETRTAVYAFEEVITSTHEQELTLESPASHGPFSSNVSKTHFVFLFFL